MFFIPHNPDPSYLDPRLSNLDVYFVANKSAVEECFRVQWIPHVQWIPQSSNECELNSFLYRLPFRKCLAMR